jgi:hypothetical protein
MNSIVAELLAGEGRAAGEAAITLEAACWAAASLGQFQPEEVATIGRAIAQIDGGQDFIVSALAARRAIVVAFQPDAPSAAIKTARAMAGAAEEAGAPACTIQVIEAATPSLVGHLARDQGADSSALKGALVLRIDAAPGATTGRRVLGRTAPMTLGVLQEGAKR